MVFFEDLRPCDIPISKIIDGLYKFFSDIKKNEIKFFYHGTYNVFEVKKCYIFRIPDKSLRNQKGVELILNEVKILHHIRKYVSLEIPDPIFLSSDPDCPIMGYKKIKGMPLHKAFNKIPNEKQLKIASNIGEFLTELHSKSLFKDAIKNKIIGDVFSCKRYKENLQKYFDTIQDSVFILLNEAQQQWIVRVFTSFLDNNANFDFDFSIVHGDFDISNILINPHNFDIQGIVDFEESRVYDRAADFLFYEEGEKFQKKVISAYKEPIDNNFEERMEFLYKISILGYFSYGINNDIPDLIEQGFKLLKKRMDQFPK